LAGDAQIAVEYYPVRSVTDLVRKLQVSEREGYSDVSLDVLLTDLRRIVKQTV
jgi:hypothetical protein